MTNLRRFLPADNTDSVKGNRSTQPGVFCRLRLRVFLVVILLSVPALYGLGEIAPEYYAEMQRNAPEYLGIRVAKIRRGVGLRIIGAAVPVTVVAEVVDVARTGTDVQAGQTIRIRYEHFRPRRGWAGPRPIPLLEKGRRYPAFLTWSEDESAYVPAARGASFEAPIPLEQP